MSFIYKRIALPLFLIAFTVPVVGQTAVDSLKNELNEAVEDSVIAQLNKKMGEELLSVNPLEAEPYFKKSKEIAEEIGDTATLVSSLLGICDINSVTGDNKNAIRTAYQALELAQNDYELLALCYNRISIIYYQLNDPEGSFENDKLSLKYNELNKDTSGIVYDMHNIGTYFMDNAQYDSAIYYYQNSTSLSKGVDDMLPVQNASRLGLIYGRQGNYDSAVVKHQLAVNEFEKEGMLVELTNEETYLAEAWFKLKDFEKASKYANRSIKRAKELSLPSFLITNYSLMMDISKDKGDLEKALYFSQQVNVYSDSLAAKNNENLKNSIESKHKYIVQKSLLEQSKMKNMLLQREKKWLLILIVLGVLLLLIGLAFIFILHRNNMLNRRLLKKLDVANTSKRKLLSIVGHDLRGSIGNLKTFTELFVEDEISEAEIQALMPGLKTRVESSYDLVENLVTWAKDNQEGLKPSRKELNSSELVAQAIKHVFHQANHKNITIVNNDAGINFSGDQNMILTIIRNLISNAIKFSENGSIVTLSSRKIDTSVEFRVKDKGVGISAENIEKILNPDINFHSKGTLNEPGSGLGLHLCRSFIDGHGGKLCIESEPNMGSCFSFTIPQLV